MAPKGRVEMMKAAAGWYEPPAFATSHLVAATVAASHYRTLNKVAAIVAVANYCARMCGTNSKSNTLRPIFCCDPIWGCYKCDVVDIPMMGQSKLDEDPNGTLVDPTRSRGMAEPTERHLTAVKRDFWWYPKDIGFNLTAFTDGDHAGCQDTRRSTSGSAQFLGEKLVSWSSKKQKCTEISTTKLSIYPCPVAVLKSSRCVPS
ncbi:uncharacterized mitochondrial protein-like protein [Tanacetum coccineum]